MIQREAKKFAHDLVTTAIANVSANLPALRKRDVPRVKKALAEIAEYHANFGKTKDGGEAHPDQLPLWEIEDNDRIDTAAGSDGSTAQAEEKAEIKGKSTD